MQTADDSEEKVETTLTTTNREIAAVTGGREQRRKKTLKGTANRGLQAVELVEGFSCGFFNTARVIEISRVEQVVEGDFVSEITEALNDCKDDFIFDALPTFYIGVQ